MAPFLSEKSGKASGTDSVPSPFQQDPGSWWGNASVQKPFLQASSLP